MKKKFYSIIISALLVISILSLSGCQNYAAQPSTETTNEQEVRYEKTDKLKHKQAAETQNSNVKAEETSENNSNKIKEDAITLLTKNGISKDGLYSKLTKLGYSKSEIDDVVAELKVDFNYQALRKAVDVKTKAGLLSDSIIANEVKNSGFADDEVKFAVDNVNSKDVETLLAEDDARYGVERTITTAENDGKDQSNSATAEASNENSTMDTVESTIAAENDGSLNTDNSENNVSESSTAANTTTEEQESSEETNTDTIIEEAEEPIQEQPECTHVWEEITDVIHHEAEYDYVHHDAVTEQVWIVDQEAWDETVEIKERHTVCWGCGEILDVMSDEDITSHMRAHALNGEKGGYGNDYVVVGYDTVHHDEVGHYEERTVTEAWDEKVLVNEAYDETVVVGYRCSICGEEK